MTPAERAKTRAEYLAELDEKLEDLPLLRRRIEVLGQRLTGLGDDIRNGSHLGDVADRLSVGDELAATVADYRETRSQCAGLLQALSRYGSSPVLGNLTLDDFPRF